MNNSRVVVKNNLCCKYLTRSVQLVRCPTGEKYQNAFLYCSQPYIKGRIRKKACRNCKLREPLYKKENEEI